MMDAVFLWLLPIFFSPLFQGNGGVRVKLFVSLFPSNFLLFWDGRMFGFFSFLFLSGVVG